MFNNSSKRGLYCKWFFNFLSIPFFVFISLNIIVWALEKLNHHCHIIYKKDVLALHGIFETIIKTSEKCEYLIIFN